ncbi:hypothetical protein UFOVP758_36 [uncultured Caudovirales phage]|uniref:Uncharacterized protein n=1 Tax=uncultured Caudovirales phage TaxID=2100421 RepID=A0A6J7X508_9CAUD|nr:hypothetical protein UFOVP758_36 [uncultured Caudovirales phage]
MSGAASNYLELKLLDHALGTATFTKPSAVYVALFTADPDEAGAFTNEISATGTGYARKLVTFSGAASGSATSSATVTFDTATANWGTITHLAICDSATRGAGNQLFNGPVTTSKIIETGDTFQITAGNLTVSMD